MREWPEYKEMRHTKTRTENGVQLKCYGELIRSSTVKDSNWKTTCDYCGMKIETWGDSPETDVVKEKRMNGPSKNERMLRDLLALIHNDSGEHNEEAGLELSTKQARAIVKELRQCCINACKAFKAEKEGIVITRMDEFILRLEAITGCFGGYQSKLTLDYVPRNRPLEIPKEL